MKWYTVTINVDLQTGEILTKSEVERRNMYIKFKTKHTEYENEKRKYDNYAIRRCYNIVTEREQQRLEF